ncbi:unnamed protein product, partial [Iphiclides podalirius]
MLTAGHASTDTKNEGELDVKAPANQTFWREKSDARASGHVAVEYRAVIRNVISAGASPRAQLSANRGRGREPRRSRFQKKNGDSPVSRAFHVLYHASMGTLLPY